MQVQLLAKDDSVSTGENANSVDGAKTVDRDLREMLTNIFIDNTRLRKQVNSLLMHYALKMDMTSDKNDEEALSEHIVQNKSIEK